MFRRVVLGQRNPAKGIARRWIEHTKIKACAEEASQGLVEVGLGHQLLLYRFDERRKGLPLAIAAFQIGPGLERGSRGVCHVRRIMVTRIDIGHRGAVADHVAVEVPGLPQVIAQQHGIGARRRAVDGVVRAHRRLRVRLGNHRPKRGQIRILKVVRGNIDVGLMPRRFRAAMNGKVLWCGHHARMAGIVALHSRNEGDAHPARQKRVFPVGLLAASPARIAKDIDVRRPECQTEELFALVLANRLVIFGARFG